MLSIILWIWPDVLQIISTEIWFTNQKTLIHVDNSRVSLCYSAFIYKQWINASINSTTWLYWTSCRWQMSQSAFFPVISSVLLYSDRKPRACQRLGNSPGVGKCPALSSAQFANTRSPGLKRWANAPRWPGGGGGGTGHCWNWLMHKQQRQRRLRKRH